MPACCFLASPRHLDNTSIQLLALTSNMDFRQPTRLGLLAAELQDNPQSIVIWDVDHPGALDREHPFRIEAVRTILGRNISSDRVFAVGDQMPNTIPELFRSGGFSHYLLRRFDGPAIEIVSRLAMASISPYPFGLDLYLPKDAAIQKIVLDDSAKRDPAAQAVSNVLMKKGVPRRIAARVANAIDEMVMNAIFDAPVDEVEVRYRKQQDRGARFRLLERERVEIHFGIASTYAAISVQDQFGSLKQDDVMRFLKRNYQTESYTAGQDDSAGAGLGIYGILEGGLSLLFLSQAKLCTEVTLFFPLLKSAKEFKEGFRFFSFVQKN